MFKVIGAYFCLLQPIDFDSLLHPFYNVTVYVQDTDPSHVDTAHVEVRITDYNDNAPVFTPNSKTVTIYENVTVGTTLHRFTASDRDTGRNRLFTYVCLSLQSFKGFVCVSMT